MTPTRAQLQIDTLNATVASLKAEFAMGTDEADEGGFWAAFAGEADVILDSAGADDYDWVNQHADAILARHGIATPGDLAPR